MKLYDDVPDSVRGLVDLMVASAGNVTEEVEEGLVAAFPELVDQVDALVKLKEEEEANYEQYRLLAERFRQKAAAAKNRMDAVKDYGGNLLKLAGLRKIEGKLFGIRWQKNGTPSIEWMGLPHQIPEGFRRVEITLDGTAARRALDAGTLPDGFSVHKGEHVRMD